MIDSEPTGQDGGLDANAQVQGRRVGISVLVSFIVHLGLLLILELEVCRENRILPQQ